MKSVSLALLFMLATHQAFGSIEVGAGYAKTKFNSEFFKDTPQASRGSFYFDTFELRGTWFFFEDMDLQIGAEAQFLQSLSNKDSTSGSVGFRQYSISGVINYKFWNEFGVEGAVMAPVVLDQPLHDSLFDGGIGAALGVTYTAFDRIRFRIRREDRLLFHSDVQPGYSFTTSYIF